MLNIIKKIFHCSTLLKRDSGIFSNEFCKTFSRMHFAEHLRASSDRRSYLSTLVGLPPLCYLLYWKRFRDHEKCFLFHLQSSFRSQDISFFVMTFWSCRKKDLIRKIRLTSKCILHNLVDKQLQYTFCPISHEVKVTRQWNLVNW